MSPILNHFKTTSNRNSKAILRSAIVLAAAVPFADSFVTVGDNSGVTQAMSSSLLALNAESNEARGCTVTNRRSWLFSATAAAIGGAAQQSRAEDEADEPARYENPNIPAGPEERSGLVVLRVAEVAQFQEKILRAVAGGEIADVVVSPQQIVFGTQILLRNSNIAGNLKLMIDEEVPRRKRDEAAKKAARTMNTLQAISSTAASIQRPFKNEEMMSLADMYRDVRLQLNDIYEYLPLSEKSKYYGYFMAVTEYEKKIADGTYNPDLDGILQFD